MLIVKMVLLRVLISQRKPCGGYSIPQASYGWDVLETLASGMAEEESCGVIPTWKRLTSRVSIRMLHRQAESGCSVEAARRS
jgi:hypothetical protein